MDWTANKTENHCAVIHCGTATIDAVMNDIARTNNAVDVWHRDFSELLGANHPSIWKPIEGLQKEAMN